MASELTYRPFLSLFKKEIARFLKVIGQTIGTPIVNSTLYLLIFGVSLGKAVTLASGIPYLSFLIPGLVMMTALNNSYQNSSSSLVTSKFHGDLMDLRVMPLSQSQIVLALALGGWVRGLTVGTLTLLVSEVFHWIHLGSGFQIAHPGMFFFFLTVGSISFACIGIAVGIKTTSFEQVNAIGSFVLLPLLYLGGVFFSTDQMHPFWQTVSLANPMVYFINGLRYSCIEVSDIPWTVSMGVSSLAMVILFVLAAWAVKRGSYARW